MMDGELLSLGPYKRFQTLKHHNLLSVLRLGSGQPIQRSQLLCLRGSIFGACSIIQYHHNLVSAIGRGSCQLWQVPLLFPFGSMFRIAYLNDLINTVLLYKKNLFTLLPVGLRLWEFQTCLFQYPRPLYIMMAPPRAPQGLPCSYTCTQRFEFRT